MNILIFGPPGSGKGTQAEHICDEYGFYHLSTGDIIREEIHKKSPVGQRAEDLISQGHFLDDETILEMVSHKLRRKKILFDGFPRTLEQAKAFDKIAKVDAVIYLHVTDKEVVAIQEVDAIKEVVAYKEVITIRGVVSSSLTH